MVLGVGGSCVVFAGAFRWALQETMDNALGYLPTLPRATAHHPARRRQPAYRQIAIGGLRLLQAGCIAFGITAIFVMTLCMMGVIAVMIAGTS